MQNIGGHFRHIARQISDEIAEEDQPSENKIRKTTSQHIRKNYNTWEALPLISEVAKRDVTALLRKYRVIINKAKEDIFQNLTKTASQQLTKIAGNLFVKFPDHVLNSQVTGIVIAGFGSKEMFPALQAFSVEGIANDILKHGRDTSVVVNMQTPGAIVPFAQKEMVSTFMEGIEPGYKRVVDGYLSTLFEQYPETLVDSIDALDNTERAALKGKLKEISNEVLNEFEQALKIYRTEKYIEPVVRVVAHLPKDELAEMAESLVNLTKFKRKVSMQEETVGGPIDVAVISKGDGFIWIKRKHYFEPGLNPQFFSNYYRETKDEEN